MYVFSFEKLKVWQEAIDFSVEIYNLTKSFPSDEKFGVTSQLKRASNSISANIAEGTSRITNKDKAHFSTIAFSSTMEVLNHIILCNKLQFINDEIYLELRKRIYKISNMLNALRKSQLNS
ncbi:four helix bundle protein [Polaribacter vadi]|uniref:Four helix bundle protein n=1 Tax=Polaribacter vadi TaxID=1774273 RepID=A0A1B8TSZ4_9FLAO|nr:four helix bundle protein [Polaribacter vadi]AOW18049.1 four helix bundle protein [Polaribacter vadi]OBY62777.1 four helix bundle protein [Polaribacter vadi]|tara:strand:- start:22523 stop:22885 length:363 start_codon:yes stop_codon:yes gene_type:complete